MRFGKREKIFFACAAAAIVILEFFVFNFGFFASRAASSFEENPQVEYSAGMTPEANGYYFSDYGNEASVTLRNINEKVKYIYIDPEFTDVKGYNSFTEKQKSNAMSNPKSVYVTIWCRDEGNRDFYKSGIRKIYPQSEKSRYIRLHPYGRVKELKLTFSNSSDGTSPNYSSQYLLKINSAVINAKVPLFLSYERIITGVLLAVAAYFVFIYRNPASPLLKRVDFNDGSQKKAMAIAVIAVLIAGALPFGLASPEPYNELPLFSQHKQYHLLAKALASGRFDLDIPGAAKNLAKLQNPYDSAYRDAVLTRDGYPWDVAYFNGKFYCYFGIVPCLIFYLPYYLILKKPFPTPYGIFICLAAFVVLAFFLIRYAVRKWFKNTSLEVFLLVFFLFAASCGVFYADITPTFYNLPVLCALDFTLGGLLLWLNGADKFKEKNNRSGAVCLIFGSLCMALVAGCRPQFLLASFSCVPVFAPLLFGKSSRGSAGRKILNLILFAVPYAVVAAGLMYYNYARFGSPFDFGANYNLTTNDMTHRGFYLGRIAEGIFVQLFQLPNFSYHYPFVERTEFNSHYIGTTIRESSYGGLLAVCPFLLFVFAIPKVKSSLKAKKLLAPSVFMIIAALVILVADIEMAGLLIRYWLDFAYLLAFAAAFSLLQLYDEFNYKNKKRLKNILIAVLAFTVFVNFFGTYTVSADYYKYFDIFSIV